MAVTGAEQGKTYSEDRTAEPGVLSGRAWESWSPVGSASASLSAVFFLRGLDPEELVLFLFSFSCGEKLQRERERF